MWKKFVAVSALFLFAAVTMAQSSEQDRVARMEKNLRRAAENYQAGPRKPYMTVNWFLEQIESGKEVSACAALSVISDEAYISSLDENEKAVLAVAFANVENEGNGCGIALVNLAFQKLLENPYGMQKIEIPDFYVLSVFFLGRNMQLYPYVYERLLNEIDKASLRINSARQAAYPAQILMSLLSYNQEANKDGFVIAPAFRKQVEARIERLISQFDYLKDMPAEYVLKVTLGPKTLLVSAAMLQAQLPGLLQFRAGLEEIKPSTHLGKFIKRLLLTETAMGQRSNQDILLVLFAQAGSGFANAVDDPLFMKMFSTGGFNFFTKNTFLSDRQDFYVRPVIPGSDEQGGFSATPGGYKHFVLTALVRALGYSYSFAFQETSELSLGGKPIPHHPAGERASQRMQSFIQHYLATDAKGHFQHYLYIALEMMKVGKEELQELSLGDMEKHVGGWDPEYEAGLRQIFAGLKHGYYRMYRFEARTQGVAEVWGEWQAFGEVLGAGGKLIKQAWIKWMPKRARVVLRKGLRAAKKPALVTGGAVGVSWAVSGGDSAKPASGNN